MGRKFTYWEENSKINQLNLKTVGFGARLFKEDFQEDNFKQTNSLDLHVSQLSLLSICEDKKLQ